MSRWKWRELKQETFGSFWRSEKELNQVGNWILSCWSWLFQHVLFCQADWKRYAFIQPENRYPSLNIKPFYEKNIIFPSSCFFSGGGLLALSRRWWEETQGYDTKMVAWGGENIDQSLRSWLCGGRIEVADGAYVAHMWRDPKNPKTVAGFKQKWVKLIGILTVTA